MQPSNFFTCFGNQKKMNKSSTPFFSKEEMNSVVTMPISMNNGNSRMNINQPNYMNCVESGPKVKFARFFVLKSFSEANIDRVLNKLDFRLKFSMCGARPRKLYLNCRMPLLKRTTNIQLFYFFLQMV